MGLGTGIECVRCGGQLRYDEELDEVKKLCGECLVELRKKEYDENQNSTND